MRFFLILIASLVLIPVAPGSAEELFGKARIIDGDTLSIGGDRIRLHGIDAPENGQNCRDGTGRNYRCGIVAASILSDLIGMGSVTCAGDERDRYGRLIAVCRKAGQDINAEMVRLGWARAYVYYSRDYATEELDASQARRGLWAGSFEAPWDFRRAGRKVAVATTPVPGCPIKGNISANGRIFHTRSSRWYDRTVIDLSKGERWFCSEREALDAGWRAPKS